MLTLKRIGPLGEAPVLGTNPIPSADGDVVEPIRIGSRAEAKFLRSWRRPNALQGVSSSLEPVSAIGLRVI